jgi:hypothetical protein
LNLATIFVDNVSLGMSDARYAYHEAGHAVAAAVLGFPFRSFGIHIDHDGVGVTRIVRPSRKCSSPFSNLQTSQTRMVIVLFAGLVAQKKFCLDSSNKSAADDEEKIEQYLGAIYRTEEAAKSIARKYLKQEAERLVDAFWFAISKVAETLWAKDCTPVTEDWGTTSSREKTVGASVIVEILKEWNISCSVDDCSIEDQPAATVAD